MEREEIIMNFIQAKDYDEMSKICAELMRKDVDEKEDIEICLATGSSPALAYKYFVEQVKNDKVDMSKWKLVKLDEWVGLDETSTATCEYFLQKHFVGPLDLEKQMVSFALNKDAKQETERINAYLDENPIDLCILGFGKNGHLGLNEPDDALHPISFVSELTALSKTHSMLEEEDKEVTQGVTIGMKNILDSKHIILLMHGKEKLELFKEFLKQKISTQLPASFLWLHNNVDVVICMDEFDVEI